MRECPIPTLLLSLKGACPRGADGGPCGHDPLITETMGMGFSDTGASLSYLSIKTLLMLHFPIVTSWEQAIIFILNYGSKLYVIGSKEPGLLYS